MDKSNLDLSNFKTVWVDDMPFLVPSNLPALNEKYLVASQLTLILNNKSVDNVLKNYLSDFVPKNKKELKTIIVSKIITLSKKENGKLLAKLNSILYVNKSISTVATESVFRRLQNTFVSIHYHIDCGYYFETFALIRMVVEQLSYAYTACQVSSGKIKHFLSPTESIKHIKKLIPSIGKLYGVFNKKTHIDKSEIKKYLKIEDKKVVTILKSQDFSLEASFYLLIIIDIQNCVFEYCYNENLRNLKSIVKISKDEYVVKKTRPLLKQLIKYEHTIFEMLRKG